MGAKNSALYGVVPFNPNLPNGTPDVGLSSLLDAIGDGSAKRLEVRLIGARGRTINTETFDLANPPLRDSANLENELIPTAGGCDSRDSLGGAGVIPFL